MNNVNIVIARFNEDLSWLDSIAKHCIVYNKGEPLSKNDVLKYKKIIQLKNVGRESHTYLQYILDEYMNVKESFVTSVFLQGSITDHLSKEMEPILFVQQLIGEATMFGQSQNARVHEVGCMRASEDLKFADKWDVTDSLHTFGPWFRKYIHTSTKDLMNEKLGKAPLNYEYLPWYINALFAVRHDRIKQHPKRYYQRLLELIGDKNNVEEAHYLERSWYYIFKKHDYLNCE